MLGIYHNICPWFSQQAIKISSPKGHLKAGNRANSAEFTLYEIGALCPLLGSEPGERNIYDSKDGKQCCFPLIEKKAPLAWRALAGTKEHRAPNNAITKLSRCKLVEKRRCEKPSYLPYDGLEQRGGE